MTTSRANTFYTKVPDKLKFQFQISLRRPNHFLSLKASKCHESSITGDIRNPDQAIYSFSPSHERNSTFTSAHAVKKNVEGIKVGDDAILILDDKNRAGASEFERAFLASPSVDPNLVPTGWVKNHYRWIVWKLASMDRVQFGEKILPR